MKAKNIIIDSFAYLVSAIIFISGFLKFVHYSWSVAGLENFNPTVIGLMEMSFVVLFTISRTRRIGFFLLCCYFGGAVATELSRNAPIINPAIPLLLVWLVAFLKDRSLFIGFSDHPESLQSSLDLTKNDFLPGSYLNIKINWGEHSICKMIILVFKLLGKEHRATPHIGPFKSYCRNLFIQQLANILYLISVSSCIWPLLIVAIH